MTLYIGNDIATAEPVQVLSDECYIRLVEERLGRDAADYLNLIIEQRNDAVEERDEAIKKLDDELSNLKTLLEEYAHD